MIGTFLDYFETYTRSELMKSIIDANKNMSKFTNEQLNILKSMNISGDINDDNSVDSNYKQFISVKCINCSITLGVKNSENEKYLIFNSF